MLQGTYFLRYDVDDRFPLLSGMFKVGQGDLLHRILWHMGQHTSGKAPNFQILGFIPAMVESAYKKEWNPWASYNEKTGRVLEVFHPHNFIFNRIKRDCAYLLKDLPTVLGLVVEDSVFFSSRINVESKLGEHLKYWLETCK